MNERSDFADLERLTFPPSNPPKPKTRGGPVVSKDEKRRREHDRRVKIADHIQDLRQLLDDCPKNADHMTVQRLQQLLSENETLRSLSSMSGVSNPVMKPTLHRQVLPRVMQEKVPDIEEVLREQASGKPNVELEFGTLDEPRYFLHSTQNTFSPYFQPIATMTPHIAAQHFLNPSLSPYLSPFFGIPYPPVAPAPVPIVHHEEEQAHLPFE